MKGANRLIPLMEKARGGGFRLWLLNRILYRVIPFNAKHGFKVIEVGEDFVKTFAPYQRKNFNHIRGIHACGIATIAEFCTGLVLLKKVDASKYRIIMSKMEVEYFFQAKKPLIACATITSDEIKETILNILAKQDSVSKTLKTEIKDSDGNHVATATITWQFKAWDKVRTK